MEREEMEVNKMRTYMVGREISDDYYRTDFDGSYDDEVVLTATNVTAGAVLENFSFELHKGEILGFGGLSECGMHELGKAVFGAEQLITGSIVLKNGTHITNPQQAIRNKIAYMSKNRDQEAIILNDTIGNNIVLPSIPMLEKATYCLLYTSRRDTHASEQRQRDVILLQKFCGKFSDSIQCARSLLQKRLTHTEFVNHVRLEIHKDQTQLLWPQLNTQQKQLICKRKQLWTLAANIS